MKENKKKTSSKKVAVTVMLVILLVIVIVAAALVVLKMKDNGVFSGASDAEDFDGLQEITSEEELESLEIKIKTSEDYVEPGEDTLDISKIQGFDSSNTDMSSESMENDVDGESSGSSETTELDITLSDPGLTVEAIGKYSGNFLEDGSDEPTANVAAMLITNNSDRMLQIAQITFQVNDTETASFKVTDLPAGTSTLVLEANKREFKEEDSYTYGETASGYMDQPTLEEDKFELITEKGKITLKNNTDQSYEKVYVYYKYVQLGGAYLGGITYRTPFENVPAGGEVEAVAGHFNPDSSKIMAVQIQE